MSAKDVVVAEMKAQGSQFPNCGATLILDALKAAGYAVVELPKRCIPLAQWRDGCLGAWQGPVGEDPVSAWTTNRYDHDAVAMPGGDFISIEDCRLLAAAMLAAADAADGVS